MIGFRMVFVSLYTVVIKGKFRWRFRASQEKSYSLILLAHKSSKKLR